MLIYIALALPIIAGALTPLFRFKTTRARGIYVESVVLATSALVAALLIGRNGERFDLYTIMDGMTLSFRVDGMGGAFAGLLAVLWPLATLYALEYMTHEERPDSFFAFYTISYGVTLAAALAANMFTMYVFFECLTLATLPLVTHKRDAASIHAGRKYVYFSISGAALGFIALVFMLTYGRTTDFTLGGVLDAERIVGKEGLLRFVFLLAFIGFGTKAAVFPMYAWLPAASVAPTPVTALLHAVAVVNTGAFAVLRLIYYSFGAQFLYGTLAQSIALGLCCFTIVFGSVMAVREQHIKRRLAYSTVSNLSYMLMGACLMTADGMTGSINHLLYHGVMKITLFCCAGAIIVKSGREYVQDMRGMSRAMPFTCAVFMLGSIALTGIPPLCGFVSKWNLLTAAAATGLPMGYVAIAALIISAVLTALYLFTIAAPMYFSPLSGDMACCDPGWRMKLPLALMSVGMVLLGIFSQPVVEFLRGVAAGLIY